LKNVREIIKNLRKLEERPK